MDLFTDKLSQKLTAQEMIKANTAADLEELNKLRNQAAEYSECLSRMKALVDEGYTNLSKLQETGEENSLALKQELESFQAFLGELKEQFSMMDKSVTWQLEDLLKTLGERMDKLCSQVEAQTSSQLSERMSVVEENLHKECVKVYRNVQAAMVEEIGKQGEVVAETKARVASVKGKVGAVCVISILAMIFSALGLALQILVHMNLLPF